KRSILFFITIVFVAPILFAAATFYEAYREGLQEEKAGQWQQAREHFFEAASLNPSPARNVRAFGFKFIRDYDPYAHLAHCEVELGLYEDAEKHLEMSQKAQIMPRERLQELIERLEKLRNRQSSEV